MTKEEIKRICQIYDDIRRQRDAATIGYNSEDAFWEHVSMMCNLSQPSLPSNLDEAMEQSFIYHESHGDDFRSDKQVETAYRYGFESCAEWMAGQGVSIDATVTNYDDGLGLDMPDEDILSGHFESGDKVIVQIRKK